MWADNFKSFFCNHLQWAEVNPPKSVKPTRKSECRTEFHFPPFSFSIVGYRHFLSQFLSVKLIPYKSSKYSPTTMLSFYNIIALPAVAKLFTARLIQFSSLDNIKVRRKWC